MVEHMRTELVLTALEAALGQRHPAPTGLLFHSDRKSELIHPRICSNCTLARTVIAEWIEVFYDRQRLHSTIGYPSPAQFEDHYWSSLESQSAA